MEKITKVIFAPGSFDQFEGTQEELDILTKEIMSMFEGKTHEEIKAMSRPIDLDNLDQEDLELIEKLQAHEEIAKGRTLQ